MVSHYFFNKNLLEAVIRRCSAKMVQNLHQKAFDLKLYLKRDSFAGVPFLVKKHWWLLLLFSFKQIFSSLYLTNDRTVKFLLY